MPPPPLDHASSPEEKFQKHMTMSMNAPCQISCILRLARDGNRHPAFDGMIGIVLSSMALHLTSHLAASKANRLHQSLMFHSAVTDCPPILHTLFWPSSYTALFIFRVSQAAASKSEYICRKITEVPGLMGAVVIKMKVNLSSPPPSHPHQPPASC